MMAKSHVVVGLASWVAAAPLLHLPVTNPLYLGLAVAGSLLPDIDHPQSWVGRRSRPISTAIASAFGHRGVTHSAIAVFALVAVMLHEGIRQGTVSALTIGYSPAPGGGHAHFAACASPGRSAPAGASHRRTGSPMELPIVFALAAIVAWRSVPHLI